MRERGAKRSNRGRESAPVKSQDVHVSFAQQRCVLAADFVTRPAEAIQGPAFVEYRALGRVDIFRDPLGFRRQDSPTEGDRPVPQIADREHQAPPESIVRFLRALAGREQARLEQGLCGDPPRRRRISQRTPLVRRPPETETIDILVREAPFFEIATGGPASRLVVQLLAEPLLRKGHDLAKWSPRIFADLAILGNFDTDSGGYVSHGGRKVEPEVFHEEPEDVPALAAHETFEQATPGIYRKIRALASMKGTGPAPRTSGTLE